MFNTSKGGMINNILNRFITQITLDHVIKDGEYYSDPEEIKIIAVTKAKKWTRKRSIQPILYNRWQSRYSSLESIANNTFSSIMDPISKEELSHVLKHLSNHKAAGPSGIPNEFWKHAGKHIKETLRTLLNNCLLQNDIPKEWKKASIILIPKPKNWKGNIDITRLIILIETARKILTRILTDRISCICSKQNILKGHNISVLRDTNTTVPIHTLNCIAEHAREFKKEAWFIFQDMKKAYNSVEWEALKALLIRIKMNPDFIILLENLHNNRTNNIITEFGLSQDYQVEDGLDQRETHSPILWRIFYDPLLCEIQEKHSSDGYTLNHKWQPNIQKTTIQNKQFTINHIAFVDDTCWIANSQQSALNILNTAHNFFEFVDIEINFDKSEILRIYHTDNILSSLILDDKKTNIKILDPTQSARYLEV